MENRRDGQEKAVSRFPHVDGSADDVQVKPVTGYVTNVAFIVPDQIN